MHSELVDPGSRIPDPGFLDSPARLLVQLRTPHAYLLLSRYLPAGVSVQLYRADGDQVRGQTPVPF